MEDKRALYEEDEIINLEFDDGGEAEYGIMGTFDVEDLSYIALESLDEDDNNVYLYRYIETEDDFELEDITDDDEFERVSKEFDRLMDEGI